VRYNSCTMFTFIVILTVLLFVLLVVVAGMHPLPGIVSSYELERRSKKGLYEAKMAQRRELLLPYVASIVRVVSTLLLVIVVLLLVVAFGWVIGIILAVIVALEYGVIAQLPGVAKISERIYKKLEPGLLTFVEKFQSRLGFIRSVPFGGMDHYHRFDSREDLQGMIERAHGILGDDERRLIVHALDFKDRRVESIMTPRSMISSIKHDEFLGPLVLTELHEQGFSRLPVINEDLDHVVGILHLKDLLSLSVRESSAAEKAMEAKVFYIRHDQTLEHALAAFIKSRHHLFIVINELRETVGLLTLEDVIEALLGRKIIDEDDNHEDLRAVAAEQARHNNVPRNHTDV
jgi:CBS domain containing-hemolysin-like protein